MNLFQSSSEKTSKEPEQQHQMPEEEIEEAKESDLFLLASLGAILYSMYQYYVRDDAERALFVGQWPQTILAMAIYLRHRRDDD